MREIQAVILAAGKSSRMAINGTKLLYNYNGKSIIKRVTEACSIGYISKINLIVGYESEKIINELGSDFSYYFQEDQIGTGDALKKFFNSNSDYNGDLFVSVADTPLIDKAFVNNFINYYNDYKPDTLMTVGVIENNIPPYARVIRSENKDLLSVLEDFECSEEQKKINEVITSQYCFKAEQIRPLLSSLEKKGADGNYYLNDLINMQIISGKRIQSFTVDDIRTVYGINDLNDLKFITDKN
jgi:bifunctional UDP-N-acetylglucosamine pyrophosphorylase / glucosamine-1-phosphate N-acetyltransferase